MPRRPRQEQGISLFPFMSVLASLIGILTLLIAANMIANSKKQEGLTQEEYDKALAYKELKVEEKRLLELLMQTEEQLKEEQKTTLELAKLKEKTIILKKKLDESLKVQSDESSDELQKRIELMENEVVVLTKEQPDLEKKLKELQAELKRRKDIKPKESVVINPPAFGSKIPKNVFFVECTQTGIVIINEKSGEKLTVSEAAIPTSLEYAELCQKVAQTRDSMILYLLRKSSNTNYLWAASVAEGTYKIRTGKLPIPNDGEIDLSLFKSR